MLLDRRSCIFQAHRKRGFAGLSKYFGLKLKIIIKKQKQKQRRHFSVLEGRKSKPAVSQILSFQKLTVQNNETSLLSAEINRLHYLLANRLLVSIWKAAMTNFRQKLGIRGDKHLQSQQHSKCTFFFFPPLWRKGGTTSHPFPFSVFTSYLMNSCCSFGSIRVRMMQSWLTSLGDSIWANPHNDECILKYLLFCPQQAKMCSGCSLRLWDF